jgi:hypothetical protein
MLTWKAESAARLPFAIELDQHGGLVTDDPGIVAGLDHDDLGRDVLEATAIGILAADVTPGQKADVRVLANFRPADGTHVCRPPEAGWVDQALDPAVPSADRIGLHTADLAVIGPCHRREERIHDVLPQRARLSGRPDSCGATTSSRTSVRARPLTTTPAPSLNISPAL